VQFLFSWSWSDGLDFRSDRKRQDKSLRTKPICCPVRLQPSRTINIIVLHGPTGLAIIKCNVFSINTQRTINRVKDDTIVAYNQRNLKKKYYQSMRRQLQLLRLLQNMHV
jgi:hypothetical protein